jgi:hypothetical protein
MQDIICCEVLDATALIASAFTLGGAVVGFAGATASQVVRGRQERAARTAARQEQLDDRRRQVLIDFQEALGLYVRTVGRLHQSDVRAAKASGVWGRPRRASDIDLELLESSRRARQLSEWIVDDELRHRFTALDRQVSIGLRRLSSEAAAVKFVVTMSTLLRATEDRLGQLLRPLL